MLSYESTIGLYFCVHQIFTEKMAESIRVEHRHGDRDKQQMSPPLAVSCNVQRDDISRHTFGLGLAVKDAWSSVLCLPLPLPLVDWPRRCLVELPLGLRAGISLFSTLPSNTEASIPVT